MRNLRLALREILPDRFLVYSLHYGKGHTSAFRASEMRSVYEVASAGDYLKLECCCGQLPCAVIQLGRMVIQSKHKAHGWHPHSNALMLEDIAAICVYISPTDVIISDELTAPSPTQIRQAS